MKLKLLMISIIPFVLMSCTDQSSKPKEITPSVTFKNTTYIKYRLGGGGAKFSEKKQAPYALIGLKVRHGSLVDAVTGIYGQLKADGTIGSTIEGHRYGKTGGGQTIVRRKGYVIVGLSLRSTRYVVQLRILWQKWTSSGPNPSEEVQSQILGGPKGRPFDLKVPAGEVAIGIHGRAGTYIDRISLITAKPVIRK